MYTICSALLVYKYAVVDDTAAVVVVVVAAAVAHVDDVISSVAIGDVILMMSYR